MLRSYLRLALFACGLLLGVQVPGFVDDYGKRVEAHRLESQQSLKGFQDTARRFFKGDLDALVAQQAPNGQIPKYVDPEGQDADFWYLGCIDATLWWLIAVDHVRRAGPVNPDRWQAGVDRAIEIVKNFIENNLAENCFRSTATLQIAVQFIRKLIALNDQP